jgi:hypothetical protein
MECFRVESGNLTKSSRSIQDEQRLESSEDLTHQRAHVHASQALIASILHSKCSGAVHLSEQLGPLAVLVNMMDLFRTVAKLLPANTDLRIGN